MLVHFMAIWSILRPFDILYGHVPYVPYFFPFCTKKNLATLDSTVSWKTFFQLSDHSGGRR
jgi:hypothetical protein